MNKAALLKRVCLLTLAVAGAVALYLLSYCVAFSSYSRGPSTLGMRKSEGGRYAMRQPDTWLFRPIPDRVKEAMLRLWAHVDPELDLTIRYIDNAREPGRD